MSGFLCRKFLAQITRITGSTTPFLKSISYSTKESSFTVSYLINSCGLSPESALSAANKLHFDALTRSDSVLKFFENHGFSKTQITNIIIKHPLVLLADPINTLEPKIQFFRGVGLSASILVKIIVSEPNILRRSLENHIIPCFEFLKTILHTDENVAFAVNRSASSWVFQFNARKFLAPKIAVLRDCGLPESSITKLVMSKPIILTRNADWFKEMVREINEMGFEPSSPMFVHALLMRSGMSNDTWEAKLGVFRSFGFSEDEILSVIRKQPSCISISMEKIRTGLDFFVNKLNWGPSVIAKRPKMLSHSLEKRVIPRFSVIQVLLSKKLIKKEGICTALSIAEEKFLEKFVTKYQVEAPELLKVYQGVFGPLKLEL